MLWPPKILGPYDTIFYLKTKSSNLSKTFSKQVYNLYMFKKKHPLVLIALLVVIYILLIAYANKPPSREQIDRMFGNGSTERKVLAYEILEGTPYILFTFDNQKIYFDKIKPDYKYLFKNGWIWTGTWYYIAQTNDPASFGIGHCTGESGVLPPQCKSTDIFGQINNKKISILELKFNGELYKYPVSYPGYIIRLSDFNGIIEDRRFLDKDGNRVWK